jgi:hypothetical protein
MNASVSVTHAISLNEKVGALALATAGLFSLVLTHFTASLTPLRLLALALAAFAAWCLCDELGMRKPLNRGGFVFFAIAVTVKVQIALGVAPEFVGRYYLLYAGFLLTALLFWSVAFLHRKRASKVVGAVGVLASVVPIFALLIAHLALGTGAFFGIDAILSATEGAAPIDLSYVTLIDRIFGLWCYLSAWLLWRGHVRSST